VGRGKKIRSERESGPLRFSDRIRNWFIDRYPLESETELDYIDKYFQAKYWPALAEKFLYRDGQPLPEMINAFFAMRQYDGLREQKEAGGGQKNTGTADVNAGDI
jgi:hypothetical protein